MHPALPIAMVFVGCCTNVVFLELLIREAPGSGNIITFAQFLLIALEGFIFTTKFGTKKSVIPMSTYSIMVGLFFVVSVSNNYAFSFNIPLPLHMIYRAGSLIANLVLGVIILKRSYKPSKYVSVVMITAGIAMATIASAQINKSGKEEGESGYNYFTMFTGISLLTFALFMSARMGIYQEVVYAKHGKHPSEALFYNHALPLPGFLLLYSDIYSHILLYNQSEPIMIPMLEFGVPKMWLYMLGNIVTQYVCIRSVFILTTECASLTVTLVITLRKFVSLLFSIMYFKNPFTPWHWLGTILVFGGTLLFTETIERGYRALVGTKEKPKEE